MIALWMMGCWWGSCPQAADACVDPAPLPNEGVWDGADDGNSGQFELLEIEGDEVTVEWTDDQGQTWTARYTL